MSREFGLSSAMKHRRFAAACGVFAANAQSVKDRELLLQMQRSLLGRARHHEWRDELPPLPPAWPNALAVPAR